MSIDYHVLHMLRKIAERLNAYVTELQAESHTVTHEAWRVAYKLTQVMEGQKS